VYFPSFAQFVFLEVFWVRVQTVGDAEMFFNFVFEKQMVSSNLKDFFFAFV